LIGHKKPALRAQGCTSCFVPGTKIVGCCICYRFLLLPELVKILLGVQFLQKRTWKWKNYSRELFPRWEIPVLQIKFCTMPNAALFKETRPYSYIHDIYTKNIQKSWEDIFSLEMQQQIIKITNIELQGSIHFCSHMSESPKNRYSD
jgi:hypothetical protein